MRYCKLPLIIASVLATQISFAEDSNPKQPYQQTIKQFVGALQTELKTAMKAGGPIEAVAVCQTKSPKISEQVSIDADMQVSRVSLKNRSPDNAVSETDWQYAVLQNFEKRLADGEAIKTIDYLATQEIDGKPHQVYMKAIPTQPLCLVCHGEQIAPDLQAKIDELYPEDKAVGYQAGQIRGAFVVTKAMSE